MSDLVIAIEQSKGIWWWAVREPRCMALACGSSPDYDEACRCARIAWEQHSKEEE